MFSQQNMSESEIIEKLKDKGMTGLDLSLPTIIIRHKSSNVGHAQAVVLQAYERLSSMAIASVDPAGVDKYHYHHAPAPISKIVTTEGSSLKITDNTGRVLMIAKSSTFLPITHQRRGFTTTAPSFTFFPLLPREIRHEIWALAAGPRVLVANEVRAPNPLSYFPNCIFPKVRPSHYFMVISYLKGIALIPWFI
jgi:hypothetical protein